MIEIDRIWASLPPTTGIEWGDVATIDFRPVRTFSVERILSPELCWELLQIDSAQGPVFKTTTGGLPLEYFGPRSIGPRFTGLRVERSLSALDRAVARYAYERTLAFLQKAPQR